MPTTPPNPNNANFANIATIVSGIAAVVSIVVSSVFVFGIYKTKIDALESNILKLEAVDGKMQDEIKLIRDKVVESTTAINIYLNGKSYNPTPQTTPQTATP